MTVTRIFLVGFMGAGKTTVGRILAERLRWSFVDLDLEIERLEGQSVADIFGSRGEAYFRARERACLALVSESDRRVVSLGGGTYIDPVNRELVDSCGLSIYLEAPLEVLFGRIPDDDARPLASDRSRLEDLFAERVPSYRMARMTIDTAGRDAQTVAGEVLLALEGE